MANKTRGVAQNGSTSVVRGISLNPYAHLEQRYGIRTFGQLSRRCKELGLGGDVIHGLIPDRSLCLSVGDSGLGKSPFWYQAGICVAAGLPFLGLEVSPGGVLYLDFENGLAASLELMENLRRFLHLGEVPGRFKVWHYSDADTDYARFAHGIADLIRAANPTLVIIDSLASFFPEIEKDNPAALQAFGSLRSVIRESGASIICVHHPRKPSKGKYKPTPLQDENPRHWMDESRGPRALINASDIRLGFDVPHIKNYHPRAGQGERELALLIKGFSRLGGDVGPYFLERIFDGDGEPLGYRKLVGPELLFNPDQESYFGRFPRRFRFKQAKLIYGRRDQATKDFLDKCRSVGLLRKVCKGVYEKLPVAE